MNLYNELCDYLSNLSNIPVKHLSLIISTMILFVSVYILKKIFNKTFRFIKDGKREYEVNQKAKMIINTILVILLIFIWEEYIRSIITLISFLSAAFAIALRDIILNWFCGIYIKFKKVFRIEDRIEIDGIRGDVTNISTLEFEVIEVSDKEENGQSTGIIISFPNSIVFSKPVKNYTKCFKYIWNEMIIKVPLDSDLPKVKQELYKIINNNDIIKSIPKKMKNQISGVNSNYRIYYNKYDPIIYTKVVDSHVELNIRYLINPKKARYVESVLWNGILKSFKENELNLYEK